MSNDEYVIIRSKLPRRSGGGLGPRTLGVPSPTQPEEFEVIRAELSAQDRADLERDETTRALAPSMPLQLIEPVSAEVANADVLLTDAAIAWGVEAVAGDTRWDGSGVTVAVLDTGIDPSHAAFAGVNLIRKNFTSEGDDDTNGHGTHCAGTIFGRDVESNRIGVARGVNRAVIAKVLGAGGGSSADIANAIQWAVGQGASIVAMSLGIDFPGFVKRKVDGGMDERPATSLALEAYRANINMFGALANMVSLSDAFSQGAVLIAASGNESKRPNFEIAVAPPAASEKVMSVGALQQAPAGLQPASFSNTNVAVSAPGVDILSAKLGGGLITMSGTSMATPHVAGIAALWAQQMLERVGRIDSGRLMTRVEGTSNWEGIDPASAPLAVGAGMVRPPF